MTKIQSILNHNNSVLTISLNDGKGNIIDHIMMEEIQIELNKHKSNRNLKLIIFQGEGKHFSFGASVEEHQKEFAEAMIKNFHKIFFTIKEMSIPTMARIWGQCLGGGLELALMCNFIFATKDAKLGQPEITLGVFPPPASILLPLKIGYARAEELLITGKIIDAESARQLGLVNRTFNTKEECIAETESWIVENIIPKSATSLQFAVKAARIKFNHILSNFIPQLENLYLNELMDTNDANEGIKSFMEKRKPEWQNN